MSRSRKSRSSNRHSGSSGRWAVLHGVATHASTTAAAKAVALFLLIGVACFGLWLGFFHARRLLFDTNARYTLRTIHYRTDGVLAADRVRQIIGVSEGCNLFCINLPSIRHKFLQDQPSVRNIRLQRLLPDALDIVVSERIPIARLSREKREVVDFEGYIFTIQLAQESLLDRLPILVSEEWANLHSGQRISNRPRAALSVLDTADALRLSFKIIALDTTGSHYLLLQTADRREIALPWDQIMEREVVSEMLRCCDVVLQSPRAVGRNRFDVLVEPTEIKVISRYE